MPEQIDRIETVRAPRPWVQVATFCETAIIGNDSSLSIIRILDRIGIAGMTAEMQPQPLQLKMAIVLKSDEMRGQYQVRIRCTSPRGAITDGPEIPFLFEGEDRGVQVVLPAAVLATEAGLYWFDLMIEDEILTRVPMRVLYQRINPQQFGQFGGPGMQPGGNPQQ